MILEKHFSFDEHLGCCATNTTDVENYIRCKVSHFQQYKNWTSRQEQNKLLREILDMVHEDLQNPDIDMSGISHLQYYDKFDAGKFIMYYDLVFILGTISCNTFDYGDNALNHTEDGQHGAINLAKMVMRGYDEFVNAKKCGESAAYGSTLIFTTVLEAELKRKVKWITINELSQSLERCINNGTFVASADDRILLDCLMGRRHDYNSVYATTIAADELFERAKVYDTQSQVGKAQKSLILNQTTLNQLVQSADFQAIAEPTFIETMKLLFGTGNLNLRNDIAHGGFGYQNYYHLAGTGLLYFIMNMVVSDFWKK